MKSDLTLEIEQALRNYDCESLSNLKLNHKRDSIRVSEVTAQSSNVRGGIIDFVRLEEYSTITGDIGLCYLNWRAKASFCEKGIAPGERRKKCDQKSCRFFYSKNTEEHHLLVNCMEIKITKNDFKSIHGHNFVGNLNYYIIPKELYKEIESSVPEEIGIITYSNKTFEEKKVSKFNDIPIERKLELTLSVLKASRKNRNLEHQRCRKLRKY